MQFLGTLTTIGNIIAMVVKYAPNIIRIVQYVEEFIDGDGSQKKDSAMKMIKEYFTTRGLAWTADREKLFSAMVEIVVAVLNWFNGWRKHQTTDLPVDEVRIPKVEKERLPQ